jgi:hypothetical protein
MIEYLPQCNPKERRGYDEEYEMEIADGTD